MNIPYRSDIPDWFGLVWANEPDYDEKTQHATIEWIEMGDKTVQSWVVRDIESEEDDLHTRHAITWTCPECNNNGVINVNISGTRYTTCPHCGADLIIK